MHTFRSLIVVAGLAALLIHVAVTPASADPARWKDAIAALEAKDRANPPAKGGIVFVGSSSIRMWDTDKWFPERDVINRGFGGSEVEDSLHYAQQLVIKHKPRVVVMYAGDNDIAGGKSPERVLADYKAFVSKVRQDVPNARFIYIAIKPSIARWKLAEPMADANELVRTFSASDPKLDYADIWTPMLGEDGKPRPELFIEDGLHMSDKGYKLWTGIIDPMLD